MNIDRPMAALFFEIKRNLPYQQRHDFKISAPDVGDKLISIYRDCENPGQRKRIEDFMLKAGGHWKKQLDHVNRPTLLGQLIKRTSH